MKKLLPLFLAVLCMSASAQTNVSGGIYSNTTWTPGNSPYIITANTVVFPGVILTIQPGVTVKFNTGQQLEIRQAQVIARGTTQDSIVFTSNSATPATGDWNNIFLNGGSMPSAFSYCSFRYATQGINSTINDSLFIKHSTFHSNQTGVDFIGSAQQEVTIFDSCHFVNNTSYGIHQLHLASSVISNCNFQSNTYGIETVYFHCKVLNCSFTYNQIGIFPEYTLMDNCTLTNNHIGINSTSENVYRNSVINYNAAMGIFANGDSVINCQVQHNQVGIATSVSVLKGNDIQYNTSANVRDTTGWGGSTLIGNIISNGGIGIDGVSESFTIAQNTIMNNSIGIVLSNSSSSVYCNKICGNSAYDLKYLASGSINVANNYWCTADSATTENVIYDGYDNISYGLVHFLPFDTGCYLTGCNLVVSVNVTNASCATCTDGSATASIQNGTAPFTYTWSPSLQSTQSASGLAPGNYTLCVTDVNGCTACNNHINVGSSACNLSLTVSTTNASCSSCNDGLAIANVIGGSGMYNYSWYSSPMQSTATASGLAPGTYSVCAMDTSGCSVCGTATIAADNCSAHFNLSPDTTTPHHYIATNMASGIAPLSYAWNWGDGSAIDTVPYPSHSYMTAGFYTICLSITDAASCSNSYCSSYYLMKTTNAMVSVSVVGQSTGLAVIHSEELLNIFPNPSTGKTNIACPHEATSLKVTNSLGQIILEAPVSNGQAEIEVKQRGIYFVSVLAGSKRYSRKLIIN